MFKKWHLGVKNVQNVYYIYDFTKITKTHLPFEDLNFVSPESAVTSEQM